MGQRTKSLRDNVNKTSDKLQILRSLAGHPEASVFKELFAQARRPAAASGGRVEPLLRPVDLEPVCGRPGPTGLCALRAHHARLIKTGDYQARSFTALEAAM